jgi:quercetin dioxygenase-like cupin family protein
LAFSVIDARWQRSAQTQVLNADLAGPLGATTLRTRMWRLAPGQALARHRHADEHELYVVLAGTGRMRVDGEALTLAALSAVLVEPESVRQVFNDTETDALWLIAGAPQEAFPETEEGLARMYPDGLGALPPELS